MRYKLLDDLTCPSCMHHPLDMQIIRSEENIFSKKSAGKCNEYCSFRRSVISIHENYPCDECNMKSITDGILICRGCGAEYSVKNGIPYMLKDRDDSRYGHWDEMYKDPDVESTKRPITRLLDQNSAAITYYALVDIVKKNRLKSVKSIEIGCGSGAYSLMLRKMDLITEPYLVDISPQALHLAGCLFDEFGEGCHLILTDGVALPFRDKSFDLSLSGGVIEHFKGIEQQKMVSEHCRVAANVACQVPASTTAYWIMRTIITILHNKWPFGAEYPMRFKDINERFLKEGYVIIDVSFHDLLTAAFYMLSGKYIWIHPLEKKSWINRLFKHEIVVLARNMENR